jgi:general secretion pathway protein L
LYIRHPSKASVDSADAPLACPFALVSDSGAIERQGAIPLAEMAAMVDEAGKTVLLLAASDVSLMRVKIPPLSNARLRSALPHMVEDQLVADPADCVVVASNAPEGPDGLRVVAAVDKGWLESLVAKLQTLGANKLLMLPAQLCLPQEPQGFAAAVSDLTDTPEASVDLTLRLNLEHGIGLPVLPDYGNVAANVIDTLRALVPEGEIHLAVPAMQLASYEALASPGIVLQADHWSRWIGAARNQSLDLMQGLAAGGAAAFDWSRWRMAMILGALVLLANIVVINVEWWKAKREATLLRTSITASFQEAFPKDPLSTDLAAYLQKKISAGKVASGQPAANDFVALAANFGEAWSAVSQGRKVSGIAGLEYKEQALLVRLKNDGEAPIKDVTAALDARKLSLKQTAPDTLEIRSK